MSEVENEVEEPESLDEESVEQLKS